MLFEQATVVVTAGHKVGFVGRNGTGKSTLIRLILDEIQADEGSITLRPRTKIACVAQEAPDGSISLIDCVLATDTERTALLIEAETATDPDRISEIHERLNDIDAYTAPTRAAAILSGLGFSEEAQHQPLNSFSGGWRMRVALASTLFADPDMLLLDEPTNHLDLEASLWLENHLRTWRGTLLMISHDRTFLNAVANEIIHLENLKLVRYAGNYDRFERTRRERLLLDSKMRTRQQAQRKHMQAFVDRFRYSAAKAKQAQSRLKMIERMEPIAEAMVDQSINFDFPQPELLSPPIISIESGVAGYGEDIKILSDLDLRIDMDDRIGLLGANGNGKSTLIKILGDRLKLMSGSLRKSSKLKVGFFAQHQVDELTLGDTAFEHMLKLMPMEPETRIRAHLGRFGFQGRKADTKAGELSGGEKARLVLSIMSRNAPHLLLLDEPTNHLDVDSREALVQSINSYEGAVVLVSHDVHLLETTCDRLWLVDDGTVRVYDGDLEEYKQLLLEKKRVERGGPEKKAASNSAGPVNKKEQRRLKAAQRAEANHMKRSLLDAEKAMEKLSGEIYKIETTLADPDLYEGGRDEEIITLQTRLKDLKNQMSTAEEVWIKATEAAEITETPDTTDISE